MIAGDVWRCPGEPFSPGCVGGETYIDVTDGLLPEELLYVRALVRCEAEFGVRPTRAPRIWLGFKPQTIRNADGSIDIYLKAGSNDRQLRYQCAHEVFHAVVDPTMIHWAHEMLAVHFALGHLRAEGEAAYADIEEVRLRSSAASVPTADLINWAWPEWPPFDVYGRAFVLGEELIDVTSREDVKRLVSADLGAWLATLDPPVRARAEAVLDVT